jgi:hypothetical protein
VEDPARSAGGRRQEAVREVPSALQLIGLVRPCLLDPCRRRDPRAAPARA